MLNTFLALLFRTLAMAEMGSAPREPILAQDAFWLILKTRVHRTPTRHKSHSSSSSTLVFVASRAVVVTAL